ncbi:hypothetical protein ERO13_A05G345812v2, partial [Gossypium hirsutum]
SIHILIVPSFFFTKKTGAPQGEKLSRSKPLSINSCNIAFNSFNSVGAILYGAIDIRVIPDTNAIPNSTSQIGGKPYNFS